MDMSIRQALLKNFMGNSPDWYKLAIITFLIINPLIFSLLTLSLLAGYSLLSLSSL